MYAKIFASLWAGSLYGQSDAQLVFVFLLAHADRAGFVDIYQRAIAAATGLDVERVQAALDILEAPDPTSRSTNNDGRRLERIDAHRNWGWSIVNYMEYRELQDADTVRQQTRERVRRHRERLAESRNPEKRPVTDGNGQITDGDGQKRHAEVEVEVEAKEKKKTRSISDPDDLTADQWFLTVFWPAYPRKVAKPAALRAFRSIKIRDDDSATAQAIIDGLAAWKQHWTDPKYIPHPATWLNQRRWEDQPA